MKRETIPELVAIIRASAKGSVASKVARHLERWGGNDICTINDAITCLRDDDKYLREIATRINRAWKRHLKEERHA